MSEFLWQVYTNTYPYEKVAEAATYTSCEVIRRHNQVGSWKLTMSPADGALLELARPDRRVTVDYNGHRVSSGTVHGVRQARDGRSVVNEVYGYDDLRWLERRLAAPDPTATYPADGVSFTTGFNYRDYIADNAETMIKYWVTRNAVTRAPIPGLVVATDLGRGASKAYGPRWDTLLEATARIANGTGLGLSLVQSGDHLVFDVYEPQEQPVRLSENLDNLRAWEYVLEAPIATRLVLGGPGDGTARKFMWKRLTSSETDWLVTEKFEDATEGDTDAEMSARGAELLVEYAPQAGFSVTPEDTVSMRYAEHYNVGDKVRVEVANGVFIPDTVTQVVLSHQPGSAPLATPTVGNSDAANKSSALARSVRTTLTRLLRQQRIR
ncbi:MAG TPA: hypothetical protein VHU81_06370 [Thermoanaerobaculia bacterium]|nr:hypothetical protein [Thermoanaerobaculia bacterium]